MKIKLDENLPEVLAESLQNLGHDVDTVLKEGLKGRNDQVIWETAQAESRFLITQDLDFSNIHQFTPGTHAGILLVRLHTPSRLSALHVRQTVSPASGLGARGHRHKSGSIVSCAARALSKAQSSRDPEATGKIVVTISPRSIRRTVSPERSFSVKILRRRPCRSARRFIKDSPMIFRSAGLQPALGCAEFQIGAREIMTFR